MAPLIPLAISLAAEYVPEIIKYFGGSKSADVAGKVLDIAKQVTGLEPDDAAKAIALDPNLALQFKQAVLSNELEIRRLAFEETKLFVSDVQDARKYRDDKVFWLGIAVLSVFALVIGLVLYGGFEILRGGVSVEAGMFAAITGFVGTLVGYVAANAQSVTSYYFGSSSGSKDKTDALADSIKRFK